MAGRVIVKARRKGISAPTGQAMPAFNFGATMPAAPTATAAAPAPAAAATTPAAAEPAPMNALQRLAAEQAASSWSCPACETNNKKTDARCGACEEPNPNPPAGAADADKPAAPAAVSAFTFGSAAPAAAEPQNALQKLAAKLASESWECPTCMTNNKMSAATCGACEEPNPNAKAGDAAASSAAAAPAASGFTFGSAPAASASGVTFGAAPAASGVTFGGAASTSEVTFGAPVSTSSAPGVFSFGASEASATPLSFGSVPSFSFGGSAGAAPLASFGSVASGASAFGDSAAVPKFEASSAETLLQSSSEVSTEFKNKSKESTGEEDDEVHLRANTKVTNTAEHTRDGALCAVLGERCSVAPVCTSHLIILFSILFAFFFLILCLSVCLSCLLDFYLQVFQLKQVPIVKAAPEAISEVDAASAADGAAKAATDKPAAAAASSADGEAERTEMKYVEIGSGELHVNSVQDPATGKTRARLVSRREHTEDGESAVPWSLLPLFSPHALMSFFTRVSICL